MGKVRRRKPKRTSCSDSLIRTRAERDAEVRKIMQTLTELGLTSEYGAVRELLPLLSRYVQDGERVPISIPVPEANRRMIGVLAASRREEVWLRLEKCP